MVLEFVELLSFTRRHQSSNNYLKDDWEREDYHNCSVMYGVFANIIMHAHTGISSSKDDYGLLIRFSCG